MSNETPPEIVAYRHDIHKLTGEPHATAPDTLAGVRVNQSVPKGADADAAALSRPSGPPEPVLAAHTTPYRLSLVSGKSHYDPESVTQAEIKNEVRDLLTEDDPETLHRDWLDTDIIAAFNESVYYPYTSLKYHTLLVAALLDNYRANHDFADLGLVVDPGVDLVPHRTIYTDDTFALRITAMSNAGNRPVAQLGTEPRRSWASVWPRLSAHPLDVDNNPWDRTLDANLRRIRSWSTALQYLEDIRKWRART